MAADGGIEAVVAKPQILHVHQLEREWEAGRSIAPSQFDHSRGQIDPNHLTAG